MAHWYANIKGNKGEATRMGTTKSGFKAHIRGWDIGVSVTCEVTKEGKDKLYIYRTGGSNNPISDELIGVLEK